MGFWDVFFFVVLIVLCMCNIVFPRRMWGLFKSWRFQNPDVVEPSALVLGWYRLSSAMVLILIVGLGVYGFMEDRRDDRCEAVLQELRKLYAAGGVSAVRERADDLGLEIDDRTRDRYAPGGQIVITEDGRPFATIWAVNSEGHCDT